VIFVASAPPAPGPFAGKELWRFGPQAPLAMPLTTQTAATTPSSEATGRHASLAVPGAPCNRPRRPAIYTGVRGRGRALSPRKHTGAAQVGSAPLRVDDAATTPARRGPGRRRPRPRDRAASAVPLRTVWQALPAPGPCRLRHEATPRRDRYASPPARSGPASPGPTTVSSMRVGPGPGNSARHIFQRTPSRPAPTRPPGTERFGQGSRRGGAGRPGPPFLEAGRAGPPPGRSSVRPGIWRAGRGSGGPGP
jgi:hypothetical protein